MFDRLLNSRAPIAVVLGGGMTKKGKSGHATNLRALAGVRLAKANPTWTFILSGDGRADQSKSILTEAESMARIFEANGIERSRLLLEDEARDTIGNAVLVAARYLRHVQPRKLYVVTSPFHATRSLLLFRGVLGPDWDIEVVTSANAHGDSNRRANEPGGIEWTHRFLAGITPGDLRAATARLLADRPFYAFSQWLKFDEPGDGDTASGTAA